MDCADLKSKPSAPKKHLPHSPATHLKIGFLHAAGGGASLARFGAGGVRGALGVEAWRGFLQQLGMEEREVKGFRTQNYRA